MSRRRTLSTLPGWEHASSRLLAEKGFNKSEIRGLGAWVPPQSIDRVTFVLLRAMAHGVAMNATESSRPLETLAKFDEALDHVRACHRTFPEEIFAAAGKAIVPGLKLCSVSVLSAVAIELYLQSIQLPPRLRLVPPSLPFAANDCEAP